MKPIKFKEQNVTFSASQEVYQPLPALHIHDSDGIVITCWGLSFKERLRVLFTGKMWLSVLSFNKLLQPCLLTTKKSDLIIKNKEK